MSALDEVNAWHPVRHLAFWQTKEPEIQHMQKIYDELTCNDPECKKKLDELLAWARAEAVSDEIYNQGEG